MVEHAPPWPKQGPASYFPSIEKKYGRSIAEWQQIIGPGGALEFCQEAQRRGAVRMLGLTSHQRPLAAEWARSGLLDMLMIRYNAAHRGAEREVFPVTDARGVPVIAYTALRWGAPGLRCFVGAEAGRLGRPLKRPGRRGAGPAYLCSPGRGPSLC